MARLWVTSGGVLVGDRDGQQWMSPASTQVGNPKQQRSVGSSPGTSAIAGVGKVKARSVGSSPGVAVVAGVGKVKAKSVGSSPGTATVAGVGKVKAMGVGASHGSAAALGVGKTGAKSVGTASGRAAGKDRTIRLWSGYGVLTIDGNDYLPLGDRMLAQQTNGAIGGTAQGYTLSLSGVEDAALKLLHPGEAKGASVVFRRLIFASDAKTLLDSYVSDRGRGDAITTAATVGGTARIDFAVESAARGLGRRGGRRRSDSDQRLIDPTDGYFKHVSYAAQKMLYWGGKRPANVGSTVSPPLGNFG